MGGFVESKTLQSQRLYARGSRGQGGSIGSSSRGARGQGGRIGSRFKKKGKNYAVFYFPGFFYNFSVMKCLRSKKKKSP
jgi:hypothetical protein